MSDFDHCYKFDPSYNYTLDGLLKVRAPEAPPDFEKFWKQRYTHALSVSPNPQLSRTETSYSGYRVCDLRFESTGGTTIGGWALVPENSSVRRGLVIGHGYSGRTEPDFSWTLPETVLFFPCLRGLGDRSLMRSVSSQPAFHVIHKIEDRDNYIHGGCVDDLWLAVTSMLELFPGTEGRICYVGSSFGGGIGALALPWDQRICCAHLKVPSFGHHPLRLKLETTGSGASVAALARDRPEILETLRYFDAATAAAWIDQPVYCACALFDPVVAPPGQFAIYNALRSEKRLFVLSAGHFDWNEKPEEEGRMQTEAIEFLDRHTSQS